MKYLLSAVTILAALCLGLLIAPVLTPRPKALEGSLVINQRIYQPQELAERLLATPYHFASRGEQVNDLIYRELLLQEAKQQKIDREADFLRSMRDFYEQSMIKALIDREYLSEKHDPNQVQIAACQPFIGRNFELQRFDYPNYAAARANSATGSDKFDLPYLDLPEDTRSALLTLTGTELSEPLHADSGWFRLQLIDITPLPEASLPSQIEQEELCRGEMKRQSIQTWIEGLYRKSTIEIPAELKEADNG